MWYLSNVGYSHTCASFVHSKLAQEVGQILLTVLVLFIIFWSLGMRVLLMDGRGRVDGLLGILLTLVNHTDWSLQVVVVHIGLAVCGRRLAVMSRLIYCNSVAIPDLLRIYGRNILVRHCQLLLNGHLVVILVVSTSTTLVLALFRLEGLAICGKLSIVIHGWRNAMQFQSDACRTWPGVRCCRVALDFSSPATLACAHNYAPLAFGELAVPEKHTVPFKRL